MARRLVFSLLPLLALVLVAELGLRVLDLDQPNVRSKLTAELFGVIQPDEELFWSQKPGLDRRLPTPTGTMRLTTNRLGLRGAEVEAKAPGEFRILSLGESTTFGAYVSDDESYSFQLEEILNEGLPDRPYRVINAGVSAYSSFQSLVYLRERGLLLEPDLVLFYHEFNDFLPSSLRSSDNTEIGIAMTDRELYESGRETLSRKLLASSAIFRFATYQLASLRLQLLMMRGESRVTGGEIGLPRVGGSPRVEQVGDGEPVIVQLDDDKLPRRVPKAERREILDELLELAAAKGIQLVVIHPAYRRSQRHVCEQTRFCVESGVPMLEAYDTLHAPGARVEKMYLDQTHPTPMGHRLLAEALASFLRQKGLLLP